MTDHEKNHKFLDKSIYNCDMKAVDFGNISVDFLSYLWLDNRSLEKNSESEAAMERCSAYWCEKSHWKILPIKRLIAETGLKLY